MIGQSNEQRDEQRNGEVKEQAGISHDMMFGEHH